MGERPLQRQGEIPGKKKEGDVIKGQPRKGKPLIA